MRLGPAECFSAIAVGKSKVQKNRVDSPVPETQESCRQPVGSLQVELISGKIRERFPDQPGIAGIVLDQQNGLSLIADCLWFGNLTMASQKSSRDFTTLMN